MEMEVVDVQNLGHDHPLMLITNEETEDSWDLTCYGCELPILDISFYGCKQCLFFLHQSCKDLPRELTHPYHPQHPLTLLPNPTSSKTVCDVCEERCNRFIYRCHPCDYDIDMQCASVVLSIQQSIKHPSHPHQLIPLLKESMFLCDACGIKHEGTSFLCNTCGFWINQKCASSPLYLKLNHRHHHTLSLIYNYPHESLFRPHPDCQICSKEVYRNWVYFCSECRFLVHFHCAVSEEEHSRNNKTETEELDSRNLVTGTSNTDLSKVPTINIKAQEPIIDLPMPDDSVDIFTQFIKNTRIQGKYKEAAEIEHFSHDHPLTYFEKPINPPLSLSMKNLSSLLNGARNAGKCKGCAQSISAPFYHCVECNFFLHVWCAELPHELRHPGHPEHTLFLTMPKYYSKCDGCHLFQNIMYYACSECCFFLDCKCASLPRVVNHKTHKHNLALRPTFNSKCISCGVPSDISYECGGCKHCLCVRCIFLPQTVRHRYDEHPFILNYAPLSYQTVDDFCEICERGIDSNRWFYHCRECDQYLHKDCVFPLISRKPYMSLWPAVASHKHQHRLTFVELYENLLCSLCETNVNGNFGAYLCPLCKFCLCIRCMYK